MDLLSPFVQRELHVETPDPGWGPVTKRLEIAHRYARQDTVLDLGAGTGWMTMHLAHWGRQVVAADYSDDARAVFDHNMRQVGLDLSIEPGDITQLQFGDEEFGSVICYSVLEHIADVHKAVDELARVLRPGGVAVVGIPNAWGSYSLLNDRSPKKGFRRRPTGDVRCYHEQLHGPGWWQRLLEGRFTVEISINLEVFTPLLARFWGYQRPAAWTQRDVRWAERLPRAIASDVVFICRKPNR
jgi:SAM-dependent methyltransferase